MAITPRIATTGTAGRPGAPAAGMVRPSGVAPTATPIARPGIPAASLIRRPATAATAVPAADAAAPVIEEVVAETAAPVIEEVVAETAAPVIEEVVAETAAPVTEEVVASVAEAAAAAVAGEAPAAPKRKRRTAEEVAADKAAADAAPPVQRVTRSVRREAASNVLANSVGEALALLATDVEMPRAGARVSNAELIGDLFSSFLSAQHTVETPIVDEAGAVVGADVITFSRLDEMASLSGAQRAMALLRASVEFLVGVPGQAVLLPVGQAPTAAEIAQQGGLATHYDVRVSEGVTLKPTRTPEEGQVFPNPKYVAGSDGFTHTRQHDALAVTLRVSCASGYSVKGFQDKETKVFTPLEG